MLMLLFQEPHFENHCPMHHIPEFYPGQMVSYSYMLQVLTKCLPGARRCASCREYEKHTFLSFMETSQPFSILHRKFHVHSQPVCRVVEELLIPCSMLRLVGWNGSRPRRESNSNYFCFSLLHLFPISCRHVIVGFAELTLSWIAGPLYKFVGPLIPSRANAQARCTEWLFFSNI